MALTAPASSKQSFLLKGLAFTFFKGLWGFKRLLNLLYVIHFFPSHLLQWHLMHLSFFFSFSVGSREVSLLSRLPNFSPHRCLLILHSHPRSSFIRPTLLCVLILVIPLLFPLDWFLDFHSFLIILFCSFTVLYGCVVIFCLFPSAFRDFLSSSWCILHLCLFCPADFYTLPVFSQYAVIYFITFISLICLISLPLKHYPWLMCLLLLSVICNQVLVQCRGCCAGLSCGQV